MRASINEKIVSLFLWFERQFQKPEFVTMRDLTRATGARRRVPHVDAHDSQGGICVQVATIGERDPWDRERRRWWRRCFWSWFGGLHGLLVRRGAGLGVGRLRQGMSRAMLEFSGGSMDILCDVLHGVTEAELLVTGT